MQLEGFKPVKGEFTHSITTADRVVRTAGEKQDILTILLVKKDTIVMAHADDKPGQYRKVALPRALLVGMHSDGADLNGASYQLYTPINVPATVEAPKAARAPRTKGEGPTKIQKCRELYAANPALSREDMIALFVKDAGCTPQGAVTYYLTCKKG